MLPLKSIFPGAWSDGNWNREEGEVVLSGNNKQTAR